MVGAAGGPAVSSSAGAWFTSRVLEAYGYIRHARWGVLAAVLLFAFGLCLGYFLPGRFSPVLDAFKGLATRFEDRSAPALIGLIFLQNSMASLIAIWLGPLLGIVPLLSAVSNGSLLGVLFSMVGAEGAAGLILLVVPHGVLELPAMFIAWGMGLWRGVWLFQKGREGYRQRAKAAYRVYLFVIAPLLAAAAVIEGLGIAGAGP